MKKMNLFGLTLSLVVIGTLGCAQNNSSERMKKDINNQIEELTKKHGTSTAAIKEIGSAGGQPAKINLVGAGLVGLEDSSKLNANYFETVAVGGLRCDNQQPESVKAEQSVSLTGVNQTQKSDVDFSKMSGYLNIGCGDTLASDLTEGLTSDVQAADEFLKGIKDKKFGSTITKKIFICGKMDMSNAHMAHLSAEEIHLIDADIDASKSVFSLGAVRLVLTGNNKIVSNLPASTIPSVVPVVATLNIGVTQETAGEGTLSIEARGADCLK